MMRFTVPDFYEKEMFNMDWIQFMKCYPKKFRGQIDSVYGSFPLMAWAGGRQNKVDNINFVGLEDVEAIINQFNRFGVSVVFTFTNSMIKSFHLKDWYCNACLDILSQNSFNAVLVNSMTLEEHIRERHPHLKIYRSTTVCANRDTADDSVEDLSDLNYDRIVADYRLNNTAKILEVPKEYRHKVEIMLNDTCPPYCPYRKAHYDYISNYNLQGGNSRINRSPQKEWKCHHPEFKTSFYNNLDNPATITSEAMDILHKGHGFEHFKIVGREFNPIQLAEIYCYYMVYPECRQEVMSWAIYKFSNLK